MTQQKHIILFDGECNFCSFWVKFVIKRDKKDIFRFASLQSEVGGKLLAEYQHSKKLDTVVLIRGNKSFIKSTAAFHILKTLGGGISIFYYLIFIPAFIRDFFYDVMAKYRFRLFGRKTCEIPQNMDSEHKFLEL